MHEFSVLPRTTLHSDSEQEGQREYMLKGRRRTGKKGGRKKLPKREGENGKGGREWKGRETAGVVESKLGWRRKFRCK